MCFEAIKVANKKGITVSTDLNFRKNLWKYGKKASEVMPELVKEVPSVRLLVIGTGPLENYFKEEVKKRGLSDNVLFFGYIEDHD